MANNVVMPKMGATMEEGTIVTWLVSAGEYVEEGDPIAEIQTDKTVLEVEAEVSGTLLHTCYGPGETVKVYEIIAYIGEEGESIQVSESNEIFESTQQSTIATGSLNKVRRTPAARVLAKEHNIDITQIVGSGPYGRIEKKDVLNYLNKQKTPRITPLADKIAKDKNINLDKIVGSGVQQKIMKKDLIVPKADSSSKPLKGMRKVIAERMSESAFTAPHVTITTEVDMTNCVNLRKELLTEIEQSTGYRLSFNEMMLFATAHVLSKHPKLNSSIIDNQIIEHSSINLGFAVSVEDGLLVPVIKDTNMLGLSQLTVTCKELGQLARDGKLKPQHLEEGTFTISNLGMYAVDSFTPIINQPQSAILGVGRIREKPAVINSKIEIRSMMVLSLSFDHRLIDGAPAAEFLTELKETLEKPMKLLL